MTNALSHYRSTNGLTQKHLADLLGVQPPAVCKWESKRVPAERVLDVARVTGIPKEQLRPDLFRPEDAA